MFSRHITHKSVCALGVTRSRLTSLFKSAFLLFYLLACLPSLAAGKQEAGVETLHIAVASNFYTSLQGLVEQFNNKYDVNIRVSSGSTGKLYSQIIHGAPYDLFLAADTLSVDHLVAAGIVPVSNTAVYARGVLVFWQPGVKNPDIKSFLADGSKRYALANPKLAPYGKSAEQFVETLSENIAVKAGKVFGESVAQVFHYIKLGHVDGGFVALSQVYQQGVENRVVVDTGLYDPIEQKMALLSPNDMAKTFFDFMMSGESQAWIQQQGYSQ